MEDILLRVACQAKQHYVITRGPSHILLPNGGYLLGPVAAISRLSRVCRVFRDTIDGSPKLQRALTARPDATYDMFGAHDFLPLRWLLQYAVFLTLLPRAQFRVYIGEQYRFFRDQLKAFLERYGKHPEASWRKVRAYRESGARFIEVRIAFKGPNGYKGGNKYTEMLDAGNGATLGSLLDQISSIMYRSGAENMAKVVQAP